MPRVRNPWKILISVLSLTVGLDAASSSVNNGAISKVEEKNGKTEVYFRTAQENLTLDFSRLSSIQQMLVNKHADGKTTFDIGTLGPRTVVSREQVSLGIRPDCTELPTSIDELNSIAQSPQSTDMVSFLKAIPAGSLQEFTLIYSSNSIQKGNEKDLGALAPCGQEPSVRLLMGKSL